MRKILFLCTHNACRSQMAEAFANYYGKGRLWGFSAGTDPTRVDPRAIEVMKEKGIDISEQRSKGLAEVPIGEMEYIIALCDEASRTCPILPEGGQRLRWFIDDPSPAPGELEDVLEAFRRVRDEIEGKVKLLLGDLLRKA